MEGARNIKSLKNSNDLGRRAAQMSLEVRSVLCNAREVEKKNAAKISQLEGEQKEKEAEPFPPECFVVLVGVVTLAGETGPAHHGDVSLTAKCQAPLML